MNGCEDRAAKMPSRVISSCLRLCCVCLCAEDLGINALVDRGNYESERKLAPASLAPTPFIMSGWSRKEQVTYKGFQVLLTYVEASVHEHSAGNLPRINIGQSILKIQLIKYLLNISAVH